MSSRLGGYTVLGIVLVFVSACAHRVPAVHRPPGARWADVGQDCGPASPASELSPTLRDSLGNPFDIRGHTGEWAARASMARNIPGGWGGLTRREKGVGLAIYLVDTTKRVAAIDALLKAGFQYVSRDTEAKQARWTYVQLYDWFRYINRQIQDVRITMWSLDDSRNRILYGVETEEAGIELDRQLTALGIPYFLVFREVTGPISASRSLPAQTITRDANADVISATRQTNPA